MQKLLRVFYAVVVNTNSRVVKEPASVAFEGGRRIAEVPVSVESEMASVRCYSAAARSLPEDVAREKGVMIRGGSGSKCSLVEY